MCASEMIEHRRNSWELYGFDFMVDDEYNAWLIEINSSPACDYSTKTTERYVQKALVELLSVVLDVREYEETPKKNRGARPDTGGWQCIYQGPLLDMPMGAFGTDMSLKGEAYKNAPRRAAAPVSVDFLSRNLQQTAPGELNVTGGGNTMKGSLLPRPPMAGSRNAANTRQSFQSTGDGVAGASPKNSSSGAAKPSGIPGFSAKAAKTTIAAVSNAPATVSPTNPEGANTSKDSPEAESAAVGFDDSDGEEDAQRRGDGVSPKSGRAPRQPAAAKVTKASTVSASTATAAIPIKVFTVDF